MTTTVAIYKQAMRGELVLDPPASLRPIVGAFALSSVAPEGNNILFRIIRTNNTSAPCSIHWDIISTGGPSDFTGQTQGDVDFTVGGTNAVDISVSTVNRSGDQGVRTVTFGISIPVSCDIDPARQVAFCQITDTVIVVPPPDGELPAPTPGRTFIASSRDDFLSKYATAVGGDLIKVNDGVNLGSLTLSRNGDNAGKPIMVSINAAAPHVNSARLGGTLDVRGQYNTIWGIRANQYRVELHGNYSKIRRVLFAGARIRTASSQPCQFQAYGRGNNVEYCTMSDCDSRGMKWGSGSRGGKLLHSVIYDFIQNSGDQVFEPIQLGEGASTYNDIVNAGDGFEIGWCYCENCNQNTRENECPSVKHGYVYIHHYHLNQCKTLNLRFARRGTLELVRIENGVSPNLEGHGPDHKLNSVWAQSIRWGAGNWDDRNSPDPPSGSGSAPAVFPSTYRVKMIGCKGNVSIGHDYSDLVALPAAGGNIFAAKEIKIEGHISGSISSSQPGGQPWTTGSASEPILGTPPVYTKTSQGVMADLP